MLDWMHQLSLLWHAAVWKPGAGRGSLLAPCAQLSRAACQFIYGCGTPGASYLQKHWQIHGVGATVTCTACVLHGSRVGARLCMQT